MYSTDDGDDRASGDESSEHDEDMDMRSHNGSNGSHENADNPLDDVEMRSNHWDEGHAPSLEEQHSPRDHNEPDTTRLRGTEVFVERYPKPTVGTPIRQATDEERLRADHTDVGPLDDPEVFEVAEALMTSGLSGKKRDRILKLKRLNGCAPWKGNRELLKDIDTYLPHGPKWRVKTYKIVGSKGTEIVEFLYRDTLEGVKDILYDSQFKEDMVYQPTREWTGPDKKTQKHGETFTGKRMWSLQNVIDDDYATVVTTFFASDETALTVFVGDAKAHPVYMTIGNLPKHIRRQVSKRGMILVGYLPITSLECEEDAERRRILKRKLLHQCMRELMAPLAEACKEGAEAVCSDGGVRRIYPVYCGAMLDFPEQCKYACIRQPVCPTCEVPAGQRGDLTNCPLRDRERILGAMRQHEEEGSALFEDLGLMAVTPFWADLPYVDASTMFPPDLLHQLYKGVFKDHLTKWSAHIVRRTVFDNRYKAMSPHHGLRHFRKGVTKITRWTGREIKEQAKVFLPTIAGAQPEVLAASRAVIKFLYLAHSSSLTDDDLMAMDEAVEEFHENKEIFREAGALGEQDPKKRKGPPRTFHAIPKIHALLHYTHYIRELGTPDGFNTELPERLHIPYAKEGWHKSNKKDALKQMAIYVQRQEAIAMHRAYLDNLEDPVDQTPNFDEDDSDKESEADEDYCGEGEVVDIMASAQRLSLNDDGELQSDGAEVVDDEAETNAYDDDDEDEGDEEEEEEAPIGDGKPEEEGLERWDVKDIGTWEELPGDSSDIEGEMEAMEVQPSIFHPNPRKKYSKNPTVQAPGTHLITEHGATQLITAITSFLKRLGRYSSDLNLSPSTLFRIWYRCRLSHSPPPFKPTEGEKVDVVRSHPAVIDGNGRLRRPAVFDTALCVVRPSEKGLLRYRPCRVRAIFEFPPELHHLCPEKLVYAEMFTTFTGPDYGTQLYKTSHSAVNNRREVAVLPLSTIRMTCHLAPQYGTATEDLDLADEKDILESCSKFLFNEYGSFFTFELMHHWFCTGAME